MGSFRENDRRLIERLQSGDPHAYDEAGGKYQKQLFAFILRMIDEFNQSTGALK